MNLETIHTLAHDDLIAVEKTMRSYLQSEICLIDQIGHYIIEGGGKRIRPLVLVLAARALGYEGEQHIKAAAMIELIHTATLLHDDVVDESYLRRGKPTSSAVFGNAASLLVGDFIYTLAFRVMTQLGSLRILDIMSETVSIIAEGEVMQLMHRRDPHLNEETYFRVIYSKTARLFEASTQLSGVIAGSKVQEHALQIYGRHLGTAFQLVDDMLDYTADDKTLGKNSGDDLREGKLTLPLLHLIENSDASLSDHIFRIIENTGKEEYSLTSILEAMKQCGSIEYTRQRAQKEAQLAIESLQILPKTPFRQALEALAQIGVERRF